MKTMQERGPEAKGRIAAFENLQGNRRDLMGSGSQQGE